MKANLTPLIFILLLLTFSCSKDENCDDPVDCLPPLTQTGANTAGCLVNGELFLPGGRTLGSGSVLHYQYLFHNGEYIFSLTIRNREETHNRLVQIGAIGVELIPNQTYQIKESSNTTVSGLYTIGGGLIDGFVTNNETIGELKIIHHDITKNTISGSFFFDAISEEGEKVEIREGRFDVRY